MKFRTLGLLTFGLLATLAPSARAGFMNGDFSAPPLGSHPFATYNVGSTAITGWTVVSGVNNPGSGSVDLLGSFIAPPVSGQTVDLDGTGATPAGGIAQLATGLGANTSYTLTFYYTNNPNGTSSAAIATVLDGVGGTALAATDTLSHSGATFANPGYTASSISFSTDSTGSAYISFISTDAPTNLNGIIIGNVALNANAVPEPASCAMLGLGILAAGAYARRRKA